MTKDGAVRKNLADNTENRVSKRDKDFDLSGGKTADNTLSVTTSRIPPTAKNTDDSKNSKLRSQRRHSVSEEKHETGYGGAVKKTSADNTEIKHDKDSKLHIGSNSEKSPDTAPTAKASHNPAPVSETKDGKSRNKRRRKAFEENSEVKTDNQSGSDVRETPADIPVNDAVDNNKDFELNTFKTSETVSLPPNQIPEEKHEVKDNNTIYNEVRKASADIPVSRISDNDRDFVLNGGKGENAVPSSPTSRISPTNQVPEEKHEVKRDNAVYKEVRKAPEDIPVSRNSDNGRDFSLNGVKAENTVPSGEIKDGRLRSQRKHKAFEEKSDVKTDNQNGNAVQDSTADIPDNPVISVQPEPQSDVSTEGTENIIPVLPFPRIKTPRQNLREFTNKRIVSQRKLDISEEKHEAKLDKAVFESENLKSGLIADRKAVYTGRSGIIKDEYGSVAEYNKFKTAAQSRKYRGKLIETKKSLVRERKTLIKSEFGTNANYRAALIFSDCTERRDKLIFTKKKLFRQRADLITSEYGSKAKFNEIRRQKGFKPAEKLSAFDKKCADIDRKIKTESVTLKKLSDKPETSELKAKTSRSEFTAKHNGLHKPSDRLKAVDMELTSVSGKIRFESEKLNKFYASHGFEDFKACNSRQDFTKLQNTVLQKSERLMTAETKYSDLGVKIKNESSKIKAFTEEKSNIISERNTLKSVRTMDKSKFDGYSGKLKFAKDGGGKFEVKAAIADYRLAKAQRKLPTERIIRKTYAFDEKSGKVKSRLKIEKEVKPVNGRGGIVSGGIKNGTAVITSSAAVGVYRQFNKYEDDNSALKALLGTERITGRTLRSGVRTVKAVNRKIREVPYKKASKLKFRSEKANAKLSFNKSATQNKEVVKSTESVKKAARKSMMKKNARQMQKKTASSAKKALKKTSQTVQKTVLGNKYIIIGIIAVLLIFCVFGGISVAFMTMFSESGGMMIASTYMSEDSDMQSAESYMTSLENGLQSQINNIPNVYVGWNEYRYNIARIGHDPYGLISYLSAKNIAFEYNPEIQSDISALFNSLYTLETVSIHEVRSYVTVEYDEQGNPHEVIVYYDYFILEVTLTANDFDTAVNELLNDPDQYELYGLLQETQGGRPDLF